MKEDIVGFIKSQGLTSQTVLGAGALGVTALAGAGLGIRAVKKRKKKSGRKKKRTASRTTTRRRKSNRTRSKRTTRKKKRRIVRGRGLGYGEIKHTRKGTKMVSFRTKGGKTVRFKARGPKFKSRRGYKAKRRKR